VERSGLTVQRNPWLYQGTGQIGLFSNARMGGAVLQAEALYYLTIGSS
jgi:predicted phage gp36 major capsid-like protein